MAKIYIRDIRDLEKNITKVEGGLFMVQSCEAKVARNNKPFLSVMLQDKTGSLPTMIWDTNEIIAPGTIIKSDFNVENSTQYGMQLKISGQMFRVSVPSIMDFIQTSPNTALSDVEKIAWLEQTIKECAVTPFETAILSALFNTESFNRFIVWPAAVTHHGNYRVGLLDHTKKVVDQCIDWTWRYATEIKNMGAKIDEHLLKLGALLHDYAKIFEYSYVIETGVISYNNEYNLRHLVEGVSKLSEAKGKYETGHALTLEDRILYWHLKRFMITHHGYAAWGSSSGPENLEEVMLHLADLSDSGIMDIIQGNKPNYRTAPTGQ